MTEEHPLAEEPTVEEPCNMERNETPATVNDMTPNATTSDGSPSLVPEGPSPENIAEVSLSAISSFTDNVNSTMQYVLLVRQNRGKPPSQYSPEVEDRRSKYPVANYVSTHRLVEPLKAFAHKLFSYYILKNVEEALLDSQWSQAIKEELKALEKNDTWKLVSLPEGKKIVGCKWVFSIKYNTNGPIDRYKVRLVAVHTDIWNRLSRNVLTCSKTKHC